MDVKTAYLNGELEEDIYMRQPEGFIKVGEEHKVCKLQRSLYGLKQAGRSWYKKIDAYLEELGLKRSNLDSCVYYQKKEKDMLFIALYVDDLLIFANNHKTIDELKEGLQRKFDMKDLGEAHYCLGIRITRDRAKGIIRIDQEKYIESILEHFGMTDCKAVSTPMDPSVTLTKDMSPSTREEENSMRDVPYQNAVGSLMYAMLGTRLDIAFAVGAVSRYSSNPGELHWRAVKRIFRYLKGTIGHAVEYKRDGSDIHGYSDADWAGDPDSRRSTTGYTYILAGGAVTWSSKKQPTVALSTTEAEYMALTQAAKEGIWIKRLLSELGFNSPNDPIVINSDNQGSSALAKNPIQHARTKHIDIRHHFIREMVENKEVEIVYCGTDDMVADILTKGLSREKHNRFVEGMGIRVV